MPRRDFLKAAPVATFALVQTARGMDLRTPTSPARIKLEPFHYEGVRLRESRWQKQYQAARDFWLGLSENDILHGYRQAAGLPAPGKPLGGWCGMNSNVVFGQWLSGLSRLYRATGDTAVRDKAVRLFEGWAQTVKPDGNCGMSHYTFDKLVGGLVDLNRYADYGPAIPMLAKVVGWAERALSRANVPASRHGLPSGQPHEWYTLAENLYRAYQLTGDLRYQEFAAVWLDPFYWNKFVKTADPPDVYGVHAYSHVNTFSSAAMAYAVTGEKHYLDSIRNAYDWLQHVQCYATGGYGPSETIVANDGGLGDVLSYRSDTFETGCGSWAAFKLTRYLLSFTGEARYGDWTERILYNGIGAALPVGPDGRTFYYSDYRIAGGMKVYYWDSWPCCSGTYLQAVADYPNLIYYKDASGLYVNLFVPSEVVWRRPEGDVNLVQDTNYPESEMTTLRLKLAAQVRFPLRFRVPAWAQDASVKVNGALAQVVCRPGTWATLEREWKSGDQVEIRIPLTLRMQAVDRQHPERVAIVRGPVAMVMEGLWQETTFTLPKTDAELKHLFLADRTPGFFRVRSPAGGGLHSRFRPFYTEKERLPYYLYFDKPALPVVAW